MEEELEIEESETEPVIEYKEEDDRKIPTDEKVRVLKLPYKLPKKLTTVLDGFKWAIHKKKQSAVIITDGRSGMGKCLTKGSKVLMSNGDWKNVEDIKNGEEVISPQKDGSFVNAKVTATHNRFEEEIYDVYELGRHKKLLYSCAWNHDIPIYVNKTHRYEYNPVRYRNKNKNNNLNGKERRKSQKVLKIMEAKEIAKRQDTYATSFSTTPVEYKNKDSLIEPYCLGAFLGDGSFSIRKVKTPPRKEFVDVKGYYRNMNGSQVYHKGSSYKNPKRSNYKGFQTNKQLSITSADVEIMEYVAKHYEVTKIYPRKGNKAKQFRFSLNGDFANGLVKSGLCGKGSATKFIPKECLLSSIDYRMKLLAGLIDTDGYVDKGNGLSYCTKSKRLAEDIKDLVFSLGGHSKVREIWKSCQSFSEKRLYYNVKISFHDPTKIPLQLKRKLARLKKMAHDPTLIQIKVVRGKPSEIFGIEIDSKSKWHVTDNWMVTHNTTISFQIGAYVAPNFSLESVHYTPESFIEALTRTKKGDVLIFDEAMLLSSRAALSAINRMIVVAMSMIRSKNLLIIFNVNSIFDLDRNLALSRADLLLHCYGDSLTDKGKFLAFFKGGDGVDRIKVLYIYGKKYYSYGKPKSNFHSTFSSCFVLDEAEYERRKQIGVDNFLKGTAKGVSTKDKESRDKFMLYIYKNMDVTQEKLSEIGELSVKTIWSALNKLKKEKNDGKDKKVDGK